MYLEILMKIRNSLHMTGTRGFEKVTINI